MKDVLTKTQYASVLLGNLFEHYDTALFGLLAPFIAPLFFPEQDLVVAIILSYAILPLSMISKPAGALLSGYLADNSGREKSLFYSLLGMAVTSSLMGFIPIYEQAGYLSPVLLAFGKTMQSFFAAGISTGGALYLIENSPEHRKNLICSLFNASTIAGILLASASISLLANFGMIQTGWRILYLIGSATAIFGCMVRFSKIKSREPLKRKFNPYELIKCFWEGKKTIFQIAVISGFGYSCYMVALVFINGFIPLVSKVSNEQVVSLNTFLLVLDFCALPIAGYLAAKRECKNVMLYAAGLASLSGIPLFMLLKGGSLETIIFVRIILVALGVWFCATLHAWSQSILPKENAYSLASFSSSLGAQLFGGPTAAISLWFYQRTEWVSSAAWYWVALALLAVWALANARQTSPVCTENHSPEII